MIDSPSKDLKEALFQLSRLKKERPALTGPADFFFDVLPGLFEGESKDQTPVISPEQAQAKLAAGVPLLRGESVDVDLAAFRRRWLHVARAVERHQEAAAGKALANVVHQNRWNPQDIIAAVLAGSPQLFQARAEQLGLDSVLIGTVVRLSLFRSLASLHLQLLPLWSDFVWQRGYCPTCGGWPLLGEFRGLEQTRFLRCGFCAAEWKVPRLLCPYCENRDHRSLGYLSLEGDEAKYRVNTCDSCHGYVKMLSTLTPLSAPQLLSADVATLHLDLAAAQRGYALGRPEEDSAC
jgi:FdhE protein